MNTKNHHTHVADIIASRTSCRAYRPDPVPEEHLLQILEAARLAPSACNKQPWVDIGIAGEHLVLAATELGLGTCWIGWIKPRAIRHIVGWPWSVKPAAVITVGYPLDDTPRPPPASRRKPLDTLVRWL